ncbi:ParB/RepB/Spo0J family partition protein [Patescibacteria group bacterium]
MPRQVLGRGLEALIPTKTSSPTAPSTSANSTEVSFISVDEVTPNPHQPRHHFDKAELKGLAESIKKHGVLQPLVVTKIDSGYELIAGERRVKAAQLAGLKEIPAIIKKATEQDKLELAIVENIQRHDLNPMEAARAYQKLVDEFKLTQEGVAMRVGKSRESVANTLRLLDLPKEIQEALSQGKITVGHAKELLSLKSKVDQVNLFKDIVSSKITVRETAKRAKQKRPGRKADRRDPYLEDLEKQFREGLGTQVHVRRRQKGVRVTIDCYSDEEVRDVAERLTGIQS